MIFATIADLARQAGASQAARPNMLGALLPFVLVFVIFYLLIIMPQRKKQKKHMESINALTPGRQIVTIGGIVGTVVGFRKDERLGDVVELRIASNTTISISKSAVGRIVDASGAPEAR
jgi:preprotein translocase subunit YajC